MEKEIVKSESNETKLKASMPKKPRARKATVSPVQDETVKMENGTVQVETANVSEVSEGETAERELRTPAEPYDFRVQDEERKKLLEEVRADALELKKELINSSFNTLSLRQIGHNKRMFALRHGNDVRIYVNATISGRAGGAVVEQIEECAPEKKYIALRPQQIRLIFINEVGEPKETVLEGIAAAEAVKQVEREEGVLIWDQGKECPRWDKMTEPSRLKFVKEYIEELAATASESAPESQNDYLKKKEAIKEQLKSAKRIQGKAERSRARQIAMLQQSREPKRPWEE